MSIVVMTEAVIKLGILARLATRHLPYSRRTYLLMLSTFTKITPLASSTEIPESIAIKTLDKLFPDWRNTKILPDNLSADFRRMAEGISDHLVSELGHPEEVIRRQKLEAEMRRLTNKKKPRKSPRRNKESKPTQVNKPVSERDTQRAARRQERFNS